MKTKLEKERFEEIYKGSQEEIPWDVGMPSDELVGLVGKIIPCFALDLGCGTGTEAIYLAKQGFKVNAIDISESAIQIAKKKAREKDVSVDFKVGDVLSLPFDSEVFEFVNDRGCFHTIEPEDRKRFASEIYRVLKPRGAYLMTCFSDKEAEFNSGPYRLSETEIRDVFSEFFVIEQLRATKLYGKGDTSHEGYLCLMQRKNELPSLKARVSE